MDNTAIKRQAFGLTQLLPTDHKFLAEIDITATKCRSVILSKWKYLLLRCVFTLTSTLVSKSILGNVQAKRLPEQSKIVVMKTHLFVLLFFQNVKLKTSTIVFATHRNVFQMFTRWHRSTAKTAKRSVRGRIRLFELVLFENPTSLKRSF